MSTQFPQVTLPDTEVRPLRSSHNGLEYNIFVAFPAGYADSDQRYPAFYEVDAQLAFGMSTEIVRLLAYGQELPQMVSIGIGFPIAYRGGTGDIQRYRARDYLPAGWVDDPDTGGAEDFLRFIREDLIPFVGSEYRVDPEDRCFFGDSAGGVFGLYTLLGHPDTFKRYIIGSPWFLQDDPEVFRYESEYAANHSDLPAKVFMGVGSLEPETVVNNVRKLDQILQNRGYDNLRLKTHIFEGETHLSVVPYNFTRGLQVVYG